MKTKPWLLEIALVGAVLVAPVGSPVTAGAASSKATKATKAAPVASAFPKLSVIDVKSGKSFKLQSLATTKKPLLIWFWAPH
jgi:hypothetical protein